MEHKLIGDADRHEPKGASLATANQVIKSNGDGTTYFGFVNRSELAGTVTKSGYKKLMYGASTASSQNPTGVNTPLQIEFGAAQSTADLSLSSTGLITFVTSGQYLLTLRNRFGRDASTGSAILFARYLVNGAQFGQSYGVTLVDSSNVIPISNTLIIDVNAGDTFKEELIRDSAGINYGGFVQSTSTLAGWNAAPSASVTIYKYLGET